MKALPPLLFALALSAPAPARAQAPAADLRIAAEALFEEGVALGQKQRWTEACKKLEASQALDPAVGTLLRLADCYERIGRRASAWARFREAQSLAREQGMSDRERIATLRADALGPKLARVTLLVSDAAPPSLRVKLNGADMPRAVWGSALPVDPGKVSIHASAPGYVDFERQLPVSDREGARLSVVIPPLQLQPAAPAVAAPRRASPAKPAPKPIPAPAPADTGYAARAAGITFAVVGVVGLGGAGGLALLSKRRNDRSLEECPQSPRLCTARGVQLRQEATTLADAATISAAAGGGLFVTGVVLYIAGSRQRTSDAATLHLTPDVSQSRLGLQARGRF